MTDFLPGALPERRIFSIAEVLAGVRALLEESMGRLWVAGEVSNLRRASSGHFYFSLKDDAAQLRAVLFRADARRMPFELEDGLEVIAFGECSVYEARGDLQLRVRHLEPRGRGALQLAFEQLRVRLEREGLFEPSRKRPLPAFPRRVGLVTSASGAALRDVIEVSGRRFPATPLLLAPTRVQGEGAEHEIAAALAALASLPAVHGVDVILVVRGGGSLEDLQPFNTEVVARAMAACPVPVISGVGHETDLSIVDLVADVRAPTPSAAAALALPDRAVLRDRCARDLVRLCTAAERVVERAAARLAQRSEALARVGPLARVASQRVRLDALARALERTAHRHAERARSKLAALAGRLDSLSPLAVL
ncbi:MAG TPA: exodeoxyribonuclease VII large subunit, partial [Deltaproteobacteria bacterium]|nr:exodeoxyribonuclease VII large subunit [Deltaproteobacteria bacterium]